MKKLLLALFLLLAPTAASAQCNGVFAPNTVCGTVPGGIPGQVALGIFGIGTATINADTIAALKALSPNAAPSIRVRGYYAAGDGGGGVFNWIASSSATDNGGSIIIPNAGGTGRWIRQNEANNRYSPEMFGARHDGSDDQTFFDALNLWLSGLPTGGTIQLSCGTTYTISSLSPNGQSIVRLFSNVNIIGCGDSSVIKMGNGLNVNSTFFAYGLYSTGTANNVKYESFTIDMNGANNSCGGTCYHSNAALGIQNGNDIIVQNVRFINNPGSNDTVFGTNVATPTITNLSMINNVHEHYGDIVNAASTDFSADFIIAANAILTSIRYADGPRVNGTAFELHGNGITASNLTISDNFNCGILGNLATGSVSANDISVINTKCFNVKTGPQVYSFASGTLNNIKLEGTIVDFVSGFSGYGIDACSNISATTGTITNLTVSNSVIRSNVTTNLGNDSSGICVGRWASAKINNNQTFNTQGPGVRFIASASGASLSAVGNHIHNPGRTNTVALQVGVLADSTAVTTDNINIQSNLVTGTVTYAVSGQQNSTGGYIIGNIAADASIDQLNWTGTGQVAVVKNAAGNYTAVGDSLAQTLVNKVIAGGTAAGSSQIIESTTGAGTADFIVFKTASQVERARFNTSGFFNLGSNNAGPDAQLTVNNNTAASVAPPANPVHIIGPDGTSGGISFDAYGAPVRFEVRQANGTQASKTATSAAASIFSFNGYGWDTSAYAVAAGFQFVPTQTWTGAAHGVSVLFLTTPNGSTSIATAGTFNASGGLSIGTAADPGINNSSQANAWVSGAVVAKGSSPTLTTGSCSGSAAAGGNNAGKFTAPACAAGTIILSALATAPNGYTCDAQDQTTPANTLKQTANTTTSVTFTSTTTNNDVIVFKCTAW